MSLTYLTAISPLDGRYHKQLTQLRPIVSEYGLIFYRLQVEVKWLLALAEKLPEIKPLSPAEIQFLTELSDGFDERVANQIKTIEVSINHDVKAVEYYLRNKLNAHPTLKRLSPWIHFALTSEDVNNLSYACMLQKMRDTLIIPALKKIIKNIEAHAKKMAKYAMLSRTHGQAATPTTLGKEFRNFSERLKLQLAIFAATPITGKCNGAVGNFNAHAIAYPRIDWFLFSKKFVESLGLQWNLYTTQIEPHDFLAQLFNTFTVCNTILIDFCRDCWGYISLRYFSQQRKKREVGSSPMPHKINPIDFENAEGNLSLSIALSAFLSQKLPISRWQRDLTDSTVLRNVGCVFGYALVAYASIEKGLSKLIPNPAYLKTELNQHWEILAEAAQTVMRKHGIVDAYEKLKVFTRGENITKGDWLRFVSALKIPTKEKVFLKKLTPEKYLGYAIKLAKG